MLRLHEQIDMYRTEANIPHNDEQYFEEEERDGCSKRPELRPFMSG